MAHLLQVKAPHGEDYPILIEAGILQDTARLVGEFGLGKRVAIITNETLAPLYGQALAARLPDAALLTMPDGEPHKNMDTVTALCRELARMGVDRSGVVVALGGGVVGDTAGFVAAAYMRGVRLVQIPTTLLSMVDSSVGGKVGVDLPEGKNLVGAFKQPAAVLIDSDVLQTLPADEWRNGMAEVIKHGLIADAALLNPQLQQVSRAADLIQRAVQVKIDVVQQDPYEHGVRQHLNLGHTFGHAVERVTQYAWAHGAAVGVGMVAAARLSWRLGKIDSDTAGNIEALVAAAGLPTRLSNLAPAALWDAMATDKKWREGKSRFVLLDGIGLPCVVEGVPREDVLAVLASLQG